MEMPYLFKQLGLYSLKQNYNINFQLRFGLANAINDYQMVTFFVELTFNAY
jgi:hypothetical protein